MGKVVSSVENDIWNGNREKIISKLEEQSNIAQDMAAVLKVGSPITEMGSLSFIHDEDGELIVTVRQEIRIEISEK
jgi:hypothetical protein